MTSLRISLRSADQDRKFIGRFEPNLESVANSSDPEVRKAVFAGR
jgi:hypothetical protein